ncbi:MAG: HAMP domain-containing protein [Candidatus Schekmanbacteria bacterium]|nr:HAMP domain-containing protein [Candidatus Schekmanbacteria bacterium]
MHLTKPDLRIWTKLLLLTEAVVVVAILFTTTAAISVVSGRLDEEIDVRRQQLQAAAVRLFAQGDERLGTAVTLLAGVHELRVAILDHNEALLDRLLARYRADLGLDCLEVFDPSGVLLKRSFPSQPAARTDAQDEIIPSSLARKGTRFALRTKGGLLIQKAGVAVGDTSPYATVVASRVIDATFVAEMKKLLGGELFVLGKDIAPISTIPGGVEELAEALLVQSEAPDAASLTRVAEVHIEGISHAVSAAALPHSLPHPSAILGVAISREPAEAIRTRTRRTLVLVGAALGILVTLASFLTAKHLLRPLDRLVVAAERLRAGHLEHRIAVDRRDEFFILTKAFNDMARELGEKIEGLDRTASELRSANQRLRQTNAVLVRTEKLASVGRLAAGIAHEINSPLGGILGYLQELVAADESMERDDMELIIGGLTRIAATVRKLLAFTRSTQPDIRPVAVGAVLREALALTTADKALRHVSVSISCGERGPEVLADAIQLHQIFTNIILNAGQAMGGTGALTITVSKGSEPAMSDRAGSVSISFTDTGPGIPAAQLPIVFDPFFTTKPPGEGTGLGLFVCHQIADQLGGHLEVESSPGLGATFRVVLPVAPEQEERSQEAR